MTESFVDCEFVLQTKELKFEVRQAYSLYDGTNYGYHWVLREERTEGREFSSFGISSNVLSCKTAIDNFCDWYSECVEDLDSNMHKEFYKLIKSVFSFEGASESK